ncbi:hypothetical protein CHS0354_038773 [Potamilus streckersoni]|uniref:Uncharacterized protein n=1 Tax=Potamilus streckersoni TaxID=2493646 RepID=A0AAE0SRK5_9BIVA|nr:hypothetical protein CHS0354_038773 [Potamilus streckersoni]
MISLTLGSSESVSETKCEYEDVILIWRNKPAYSYNDVKAMAWYKEKYLIATWEEGKGFKEYSPYIGRLMQIRETGIKLKASKRSDSGSYWLSLTLASIRDTLEAIAPSSKCKPNITEEGSVLKAKVPSDGCGTPALSPKWKKKLARMSSKR